MQVIDGYNSNKQGKSKMFDFRLYHLNRPRLLRWRRSRHGGAFVPDAIDRIVIDLLPRKHLVAVDCAGWYFKKFGISTQCIETSNISTLYWPDCSVEYDVDVFMPTYINDDPVLFRNPWFLKYATVDTLVKFIELWCKSVLILEFSTKHIQYNHLKFKLVDIVARLTKLKINETLPNVWIIEKL